MSEMTASEAREAHRIITLLAQSEADAIEYGEAEDPPASRTYIAAMQRAAVALDAYADGIDAAAVEREACANAQGMERLAITMWRETEDAARSAVRGDAEPPRNVSTDAGLDLFLVVQKTIADAEARGRAHGLLAAAWLADSEYARTISRRDQEQAESPDREWWDASALGVNVVRSAIVFLGHDAAEATRDE